MCITLLYTRYLLHETEQYSLPSDTRRINLNYILFQTLLGIILPIIV